MGGSGGSRSRKRQMPRRTGQRSRPTCFVAHTSIRGQGRSCSGDYAARWLANQTTDPLTRQEIGSRLRRYVQPYALHRTELGKIKPSTVQAWLRLLAKHGAEDGRSLAESTKAVVFSHVSAILNAANDDEVIAKNPCRAPSVKPPRADTRNIVPWTREWVTGMHAALPPRYRIFVPLCSGLGLRQGEVFGLSPDDVDFLRGWVTVRRQVKIVGNRLVLAAPKGRKDRQVPLPTSVREELAAYLASWPAREVTLPWGGPEGTPVTVPLAVSTRESKACNRNQFNQETWKPALERVGIPRGRENGMHALRHFYASTLLDAGESVKAVSQYLGHSSAKITLDVYAHVMPSSEDRTRGAVDAAWHGPSTSPAAVEGGMTSTDVQNRRNSSGSTPRSAS